MQSSSPEKCIDDGPLTEDFSKKLRFPEEEELVEEVEADEDQEEDDDDEEFSFSYVNAEGSPITAEEAFEDGHIRPAYPLFNRNLLFDYQNDSVSATDDNSETVRPRLRKLFVEDRDGDGDGKKAEEGSKLDPLGPYCSWSGGTVEEASLETCRKSNSTGFSKLWRFRDLVLRSNSDGRDAFVFVNKTQSSSSSSAAPKLTSEDDFKPMEAENKSTKGKEEMMSLKKSTKSAHEKLYMRNRAMKEEGKRRSYLLPYKQVGFFTNVNGLSRNINPF